MARSKKELIQDLMAQLDELPHRDEAALDALKRKTEMVIRNVFEPTSKYLTDLKRINFHPMVYPTDDQHRISRWNSGTSEFKNLLSTMLEELNLFGDESVSEEETSKKAQPTSKSNKTAKIFIVHGRDDAIKTKVARFLEKFDIEAIILHEKPNSGRTIIEKFEGEAADADFAIVLLTADDQGMLNGSEEGLQPRARQNVILELGYFMGILTRSKVVALRESGVELPTDYAGVVYVDLDEQESWKFKLATEIKTAGIDIDLNKAI